MENFNYYIYKTTNKINGKIYIGQRKCKTSIDEDKNYIGSGKIFKKAIKKYGLNEFNKEIIEICNQDNLSNREIHWILFFNATNYEVGYNVSIGGNGGNLGEKVNKKIANSVSLLHKNPEYLLNKSNKMILWWANMTEEELNEIKLKRSINQTIRCKNPLLRQKISTASKNNFKNKEWKDKFFENRNEFVTPIVKISPDGNIISEFYSQTDASIKNNIPISMINSYIRQLQPDKNYFFYLYKESLSVHEIYNKKITNVRFATLSKNKVRRKKRVVIVDTNTGEFLEIFYKTITTFLKYRCKKGISINEPVSYFYLENLSYNQILNKNIFL